MGAIGVIRLSWLLQPNSKAGVAIVDLSENHHTQAGEITNK